jgi:molecular chaperone GrpE
MTDEIMKEEVINNNGDNSTTDAQLLDAGETSIEEPVVEASEKKSPSLEEQLAQAKLEAAQNLDNWQRTAAELANFKRRTEERLKLQRDQLKSEVLDGVISSLDDLNLAFQNTPQDLNSQVVGWVEGFRLVQRKLNKMLDDQMVTPINTEGQFNPMLHEAVSYEESATHAEGEIIAELRKGYQTSNRVLRPALVRVAK